MVLHVWQLFTIDATLEHAVGSHENDAGNATVIGRCFLHLEHSDTIHEATRKYTKCRNLMSSYLLTGFEFDNVTGISIRTLVDVLLQIKLFRKRVNHPHKRQCGVRMYI